MSESGPTQPPPEIIERFGLKLTRESFDSLGEALDRITEAERQAWRNLT